MRKLILTVFFAVQCVFVYAQKPSPENYKKLKELAAELDSKYKADQVRIQKYLKKNKAARNQSDGIITGFRPNGQPIYAIDHNNGAATATRTTNLYPGGTLARSLTGKGMIVGIWENGGANPAHQEFGGRLIVKDPADDIRNHASHVAGTIIAAGINQEARGMAYEATGHMYSGANYLSEVASAAAEGLLVSNHSYGKAAGWHNGSWRGDPDISSSEDWAFGIYNDEAVTLDRIGFLAPYYLLIRSAGNEKGESGDGSFPPDGPFDSMTGEALAKNVLAIGNVNPLVAVPENGNDIVLENRSSWGPADDGRVKPDLVAPGSDLLSASSEGNDLYRTSSGTSMSTPVTVGNSILLQQLHQQLYGTFMKAATLKGVLLHTVLDVGFAPGPDYSNGWGFLDANMAARTIGEKGGLAILSENTLTDQSTFETTFEVTDPGSPLVVSISWTDPAGEAITTAVLDPTDLNLVNDLDIRVTAPGGAVAEPWILDPSNPSKAAAKGDNFRDNLEKIEVANPSAGTYTISISHKGSLVNGAQDYTLIATNLSRNDHRKTFYWVGESGNWNDASKWSGESGGVAIGEVPTANDRVIFDENSFNATRTVTLDEDVSVYQITWLVDNGSRINFNGKTMSTSHAITLEGTIATSKSKIRLSPSSLTGSVILSSPNEELSLELDQNGKEFIFSGKEIELKEVNLISGNLTVFGDIASETIDISSDNAKKVNLDNATIITSKLNLGDLSAINDLSLDNSNLVFDRGDGQHRITSTNPFSLQEISLQSGALTISNDGTFDKINMSSGTGLSLTDQTKIELSDLSIEATSDERVSLNAASGSAIIESNSFGKFCFDFVDIEQINVSGNSKFVYESNSTNTGGTGWIESQCEDVLFASFNFRSPCANNTTFFEDMSDGNPESWSWDFGDGTSSSSQNPNHTYDTPGTYSAVLTIKEGSETSSSSQEIEVITSSISKPIISLSNGRLLTNTPGQLFQWFLDGVPIDGETSRLLSTSPEAGAYQVELTDEGCVALSEPFTIVGTEDSLDFSELVVYPNPATDVVNVLINEHYQDVSITLSDMRGRVLRMLSISLIEPNEVIEVPILNLDQGIYILNFAVKGEKLAFRKVVVGQ